MTADLIHDLETATDALPPDNSGELREALDVRDLLTNPDLLEQAANEIDCCPGCDNIVTEHDVNFSMCVKADAGEYCPNDVAETLRAVARALTTSEEE